MVPTQIAWLGSIISSRVTTVCETRAYTISAKTCQARSTAGINPLSFFISPICAWYAFTFEQIHHDIYADDTTLSLSAKWNNITSLTKAPCNDLENIEKWSTENKMYINTEKTKALLVTGKRLQHTSVSFLWKQLAYNYTLTPQNINQILHHKLLGLIIDKDLSFEAYIDELCTRNCQNNLEFWGSLVLISSKATN